MDLFQTESRRKGLVWLNSLVVWLFPKDKSLMRSPGIQLALVTACVVLIVLTVNLIPSDDTDTNVAQKIPSEETVKGTDQENSISDSVKQVNVEGMINDFKSITAEDVADSPSEQQTLQREDRRELDVLSTRSGEGAGSSAGFADITADKDSYKEVITEEAESLDDEILTMDSNTEFNSYFTSPATVIPPDGFTYLDSATVNAGSTVTYNLNNTSTDIVALETTTVKEKSDKSGGWLQKDNKRRKSVADEGIFETSENEDINSLMSEQELKKLEESKTVPGSVSLEEKGTELINILYTAF